MARRVYVRVLAEFDEEGGLYPVSVTWEDGRVFEIDRVLDVKQAVSGPAQGRGLRYTIRIRDVETYLYRAGDRWFMQGADA